MAFTSTTYLLFFVAVFLAYWSLPSRKSQNLLLLTASYLFYGWIHPWFCILIAASTVVDYICALAMANASRKRLFLCISVISNLGLLATFKYFNFFAENIHALTAAVGLSLPATTLDVVLPVGISFYTFQTLSYTIDVYRGELRPRTSFLDFALFVSFFPQLVAGPIERASRFLPQTEKPRRWSNTLLTTAVPLILTGYLKKLVVADNVAVTANNIFMLQHPPLSLLAVGSLAFAIQIFADFSAYTDIARGCAKLLGFDLMRNFDNPYLAISPSDFWRRWHISFSSWIRDYLYIPLGGSKARTPLAAAAVALATMTLSGLWHGAAWHFVAWGAYHGILLVAYRAIGCGGRWKPSGLASTAVAWTVMQALTVFGWTLFRCPTLAWLWHALTNPSAGLTDPTLTTAVASLLTIGAYTLPWLGAWALENAPRPLYWPRISYRWAQVVIIVLLANTNPEQFIYFQF